MLVNRIKNAFIITIITILLAGCATHATDPRDPYEGFNRAMFKFNNGFDKVLMRPVAKTYETILPEFVRERVTNFFSNIGEINAVANDILQFDFYHTMSDTWRFIFNSTIGIGGLFDVATKLDLPKHRQGFGLTLAKYGYHKSSYLVLPIIGPSTFRDSLGYAADAYISLGPFIKPAYIAWSLTGLYLINSRANLLPAENLLNATFDKYAFIRNAYLQSRQLQVERALATGFFNLKPTPKIQAAKDEEFFEPPGSLQVPEETNQPKKPSAKHKKLSYKTQTHIGFA